MAELNTMNDAAHNLDHIRSGMYGNKILLEDIAQEVAHFSEKANDAHPELAQLFLVEVKAKLRLLTTLLLSAEKDMNRDYEELDKVSSFIFEQTVRKQDTDPNKKATILRFEKENGRLPADEQELRMWLSSFMKIAQERTKKA